ncbi:hypothetical protein YPPY98_1038, partial [Yersinia pestis PY-98]
MDVFTASLRSACSL